MTMIFGADGEIGHNIVTIGSEVWCDYKEDKCDSTSGARFKWWGITSGVTRGA
jgi:hypothetical protein